MTVSEYKETHRFKQLFDANYPMVPNYNVLDQETTGLNATTLPLDYVLQIGHIQVVDNQIASQAETLLNWPQYTGEFFDVVRAQLAVKEAKCREFHNAFKYPDELLVKRGFAPLDVLNIYLNMYKKHQEKRQYITTHNGFHFDIPLLQRHFAQFLGSDFVFDLDLVIDVGLMEKANQTGQMPYKNETLASYHHRLYHKVYGGGARWGLTKYILPHYNIDAQYGLDLRDAHSASFDCLAAHYAYQHFMGLADAD